MYIRRRIQSRNEPLGNIQEVCRLSKSMLLNSQRIYECVSCSSPYRASSSLNLITLELNSPEKYSILDIFYFVFYRKLLRCWPTTIYTKPPKDFKLQRKYQKLSLVLLSGEGHTKCRIKIMPLSFQSMLFIKSSQSFKKVKEQQPHT